ncbi:Bax inhibitor-1/YccA family protein [Desertibaculum subflavum]|uniref:Bax inhibitor-1/YccA family protein n=1 Tax=Desertibaculum subflavum TaxID=2268458 RepID=UPI000E671733
MATKFDRRWAVPGYAGTATQVDVDQALRAHMLKVYNIMASGLLLSGIVALAVSMSPALVQAIFMSPLRWVVLLAPLGLIMWMSFGYNSMSARMLSTLYWVFTGLMGLSLASLFLIYTGSSVVKVFFITAATFGAASLYGYLTKKDLTSMGTFLFMGLIGLIIAGLVNLFLQSPMMHFVISAIGVLVFTGLTAYDTQNIKAEFDEGHAEEVLQKGATMSAVRLYLNFVNLFQFMLSILGNRN